MRHFSRRYRCVAFNARGYPPSEVPASPSKYSHMIAADDIRAVMRHLGIAKSAHRRLLDGRVRDDACSAALPAQRALADHRRRGRRRGAGSPQARAVSQGHRSERAPLRGGRAAKARRSATGTRRTGSSSRTRIRAASASSSQRFAEHSALGHANTLRGVQLRRPPLYTMEKQLARLKVPLHAFVGDEDESALESQPLHQARLPGGAPHRRARDRPSRQRRGAGSLQPHDRRFPHAGRFGTLAAARSAVTEEVEVVRVTGRGLIRARP